MWRFKKKSHFVRWFLQLHPFFNILNQCHDFPRWIFKGALKIYNKKFQCNIKTSCLQCQRITRWGLHPMTRTDVYTWKSILGIKPANLLLFSPIPRRYLTSPGQFFSTWAAVPMKTFQPDSFRWCAEPQNEMSLQWRWLTAVLDTVLA